MTNKEKLNIELLHTLLDDDNLKKAKELIKQGADINYQNKYGQTILYVAIEMYGESDIDFIIFLLENGADPSIKDKDRYSPMINYLFRHTYENIHIIPDLIENWYINKLRGIKNEN